MHACFRSADPHPLESVAMGVCARTVSGISMLPVTVVKARFEVRVTSIHATPSLALCHFMNSHSVCVIIVDGGIFFYYYCLPNIDACFRAVNSITREQLMPYSPSRRLKAREVSILCDVIV